MTAITFEITSSPSRSKGWARYAAPLAGVKSSTGNRWVSADHDGAAEDGAELAVELEVELVTGKNKRKERTASTVALVAADGAECDVALIPGSQGIRLHITGARLA